MSRDDLYMRQALDLAARGRGFVEPNPMVGAVIVRDGTVVGEGYHERFGGDHAEIRAIAVAGQFARGATLYLTLEPCCHYGKTPPCSEAIVAAGITRVVAAMSDPFEKVAGGGFARLRAAGVAVEVGLLESEARVLNAPFLKLILSGIPYVHAKWAMTLDGKIATATGDSKWITGDSARQAVHELRGRMDAIVVGVQTVLTDDPLLTARPSGPRIATRVVLDSRARLPATSKLVRTARDYPVLVATTDRAPTAALESLRQSGCDCLVLPHDNQRGIDVPRLLEELGHRKLTNILVEGGSQVLGSFHDAQAIDEVYAFIAAKTFGGATVTAVAGSGVGRIEHSLSFSLCEVRQFGDDCLIRARRL